MPPRRLAGFQDNDHGIPLSVAIHLPSLLLGPLIALPLALAWRSRMRFLRAAPDG
jgi:hypothetical protein